MSSILATLLRGPATMIQKAESTTDHSTLSQTTDVYFLLLWYIHESLIFIKSVNIKVLNTTNILTKWH